MTGRFGPLGGLAALDRRLVAPGPAATLVAVRRLLAAAIAVRLLVRPWWSLADRPAELYEPVAVIAWLPHPSSTWLVAALQLLGLAGALLVVARRAPRAGFALAWGAYTVLAAAWGSSGKVMHNEVVLVTVALPLLFAAAPRRDEVDGDDVRWGWPPRAALVALGGVYLATGVQKLRHSGLGWALSDNLSWVVRQGTSPLGAGLNATVADQHTLTRLLALGALAVEVGAPLLLAVRRLRPLFALLSLLLHGSIWVLLGLDYSAWVLTAAAVSLPLARLPLGRPAVSTTTVGVG